MYWPKIFVLNRNKQGNALVQKILCLKDLILKPKIHNLITLFLDGILTYIMIDNDEIWCKLSALAMVYIH